MSNSENENSRFLESLTREAANYQIALSSDSLARLENYYLLVTQWNPRLHLVAPCSPEEFATRHIVESLALLHQLPIGASVADIGSGAGLPLLPCLLVRRDLTGFLIESAKKKAIFLNEVLKETRTDAKVINQRFQDIEAPAVQFISCRAIEKFEEVLPKLTKWAPLKCTLLLFGGEGLKSVLEDLRLNYSSHLLPRSDRRYLYVAKKA